MCVCVFVFFCSANRFVQCHVIAFCANGFFLRVSEINALGTKDWTYNGTLPAQFVEGGRQFYNQDGTALLCGLPFHIEKSASQTVVLFNWDLL